MSAHISHSRIQPYLLPTNTIRHSHVINPFYPPIYASTLGSSYLSQLARTFPIRGEFVNL